MHVYDTVDKCKVLVELPLKRRQFLDIDVHWLLGQLECLSRLWLLHWFRNGRMDGRAHVSVVKLFLSGDHLLLLHHECAVRGRIKE